VDLLVFDNLNLIWNIINTLNFFSIFVLIIYLSRAFSASSSSPFEEFRESDLFLTSLGLRDAVLLVSLVLVVAAVLVPFVIIFLVRREREVVDTSWLTLSTEDVEEVLPMLGFLSLNRIISLIKTCKKCNQKMDTYHFLCCEQNTLSLHLVAKATKEAEKL
jgi:hypothetical protein